MTVAELIVKLQSLPPDLPVVRKDDGEWWDVAGVYQEHATPDGGASWRWAQEDDRGAVPVCLLGA